MRSMHKKLQTNFLEVLASHFECVWFVIVLMMNTIPSCCPKVDASDQLLNSDSQIIDNQEFGRNGAVQ